MNRLLAHVSHLTETDFSNIEQKDEFAYDFVLQLTRQIQDNWNNIMLWLFWEVSDKSLSDSKSPQVSRALLSILADHNKAVVWLVSTRPLISKSSSLYINPLVAVTRAPITLGITVTFMFHRFSVL